ncbi:MAG: LamG domain-containing protein, partial [Phycisphaerales bacterium]
MEKSFVSAMVVCILVISSSVSADITDGLIGYWPLDEGTGTRTADMSPAEHGFDGTLIGGPVWTGGQFGSALHFDGTDDYVLCAERVGTGPGTYPEELMPENFTISCWVNLDQFRYYFNSFVGNGLDTGGDECGFFLYEWGWVGPEGPDFGLALRTESGGMLYLESPAVYDEGTWYHVAATYDSTTSEAKLYVDGADAGADADGSASGAIVWVSPTSGNYPERFAIGVWLDPGYDLWIDGIIDEVGYWGRALTSDEISTIYSMGEPLIPPPNPALAADPVPADQATDVAPDVVLKWTAGDYAPSVNGHKLYLSDSFDDVSSGAAGADRGLTSNPEFDTASLPFVLDFGTTYYWRIDEANSVT